ncbi:MAG: hypothetical protein ABSE63_06740 [Thermoguttaceae bacterium]|jgi:hypothetical protein
MSDSKQADHWDLLASVLGAEPQKKEPVESPPQAEEKTPKTTEDVIIDDIIEDIIKDADVKASEPEPPSQPAATPPARPISNWDALALDLGIEVKPELPPPAPIQAAVPRRVENKAAVRAEQPREVSRPAFAEFGKHIEPSGISEPLSAEEEQEQKGKKTRHRRRRHRKGRDKDRPIDEIKKPSFATRGNAALEDDSAISEVSLEKSDESGMELEEEPKEDEAEKQHLKHRHSRRGSRKRRKKGSENDKERGVEAKKAGPSGRAEAAVSDEMPQDFAGEEENADEEYEDRGERGAKSGFRAIPTWEEAVGCIVAKNMESRPRRQGGGPPRSRSESHKRRRK